MKISEVRELRMIMCGGICEYPGCTHYEGETHEHGTIVKLQMHHALITNSKQHKYRHPILKDSLINMRMVCYWCHELHRGFWGITDHHADCLEKYLQELKESK